MEHAMAASILIRNLSSTAFLIFCVYYSYGFVWHTALACPLCTKDDYTWIDEKCKVLFIYSKSFVPRPCVWIMVEVGSGDEAR